MGELCFHALPKFFHSWPCFRLFVPLFEYIFRVFFFLFSASNGMLSLLNPDVLERTETLYRKIETLIRNSLLAKNNANKKERKKKWLNCLKYVGFSDSIFFSFQGHDAVQCPTRTILSCLFDCYRNERWIRFFRNINTKNLLNYLKIACELKNNVQWHITVKSTSNKFFHFWAIKEIFVVLIFPVLST